MSINDTNKGEGPNSKPTYNLGAKALESESIRRDVEYFLLNPDNKVVTVPFGVSGVKYKTLTQQNEFTGTLLKANRG